MSVAGGHAQRQPTLTELYTAQTFLFLLQNGQNTATGDPELDPERLWQVDVGLELDRGSVRAGINGFHAWVQDYVTFENLNVFTGPPNGQVEQVSLQFVNTELATLAGAEAHKAAEPLIAFFAPKHFVGNAVQSPIALAIGAVVVGKRSAVMPRAHAIPTG